MTQPFIGEIRLFPYNFQPLGWAFCNGQVMPIAEYDALFSLIGTYYGGDGQNTFALPDLRGRVPVHFGQGPGLTNRTIAELGGVETVTLTTNQMPAHTHALVATTNQGNVTTPGNTVVLAKPVDALATPTLYTVPGTQAVVQANMASAIAVAGGSQPHTNMMPTLAANFCIALEGVYPSRS